MLRKTSFILVSWFLLTTLTLAQESRSDLSVNVTGAFSTQSAGNNVTQDPSNSLGFLATYRFKVNRLNSVEVNYGITRNTQYYATRSVLTGEPNFFAVQSNVNEVTADYVLTPGKSGKLSPFLLAGGGALIFNPTGNSFGATPSGTEIKGAFSYGGGADYRILRNLALRFEYRGLVYKAPDFYVPGLATGSFGHMAEPSIGLVFHF